MKTQSLRFIAFATAGIALIAAPTLAFAHAKLASSVPAANAKLAASPKNLVLKFSENVAPSLTTVEIDDAKNIAAFAANGKDACTKAACTFTLPLLQAGVYTVKYHVVSSDDGHVVDGTFKFTIKTATN